MTSSGVVAKRDEVKIQKVDIKLRHVDLFSSILISIDCTPFVERTTYLHPYSCPNVNREYTATPILLFFNANHTMEISKYFKNSLLTAVISSSYHNQHQNAPRSSFQG